MSSNRIPVLLDAYNLPHCPTPESRDFVAKLVACGLEVPQIAFCMHVTPLEVKQHYTDELEFGLPLVNAKVGAALLNNALKGDTNAQTFWLKTRARWVPADKEDPKEKEKSGRALEDRRRFMDEIVATVARNKQRDEAATVTQRATPGSKRVQ